MRAWLADPVKVLGAMNQFAALACLFVGTELGWNGWPFLLVGAVVWVELRRVAQ